MGKQAIWKKQNMKYASKPKVNTCPRPSAMFVVVHTHSCTRVHVQTYIKTLKITSETGNKQTKSICNNDNHQHHQEHQQKSHVSWEKSCHCWHYKSRQLPSVVSKVFVIMITKRMINKAHISHFAILFHTRTHIPSRRQFERQK